MVLEIKFIERKDKDFDQHYKKFMKELDLFFEKNWKHHQPIVFFIPNRKSLNIICGRETEEWITNVTSGKHIYMMNFDKVRTETCHKKRTMEQNWLSLKHELAHAYTNLFCNIFNTPAWLHEGISTYVSGQINRYKKPEKFENFIKFHKKGTKGDYRESAFAIKYLVEKFGKGKLFELLEKTNEAFNEDKFKEIFNEVYGFELKYENFEII